MLSFLQQQGTLYSIGFSFFFLLAFTALNRLMGTLPSPVNRLILRWIRLVISGLFAAMVLKLSLLPHVPYWRLLIMSWMAWGLAESCYLWFFIFFWNKSQWPLFPGLFPVEKGDWPANRRFFLIKDWIHLHHYELIQVLEYRFFDEAVGTVFFYRSPDKLIQLQVMVTTDLSGVILDQVALVSKTEKGRIFVTDNVFMPFGGVFPSHWNVERRPCMRSLERLANLHSRRISQAAPEALTAFEEDPETWLRSWYSELQNVNRQAGLLNAAVDLEEMGKMTSEGRYRLWKESLLLHYFGRGLRT
jgi:hypothetical protein